MRIVAALSGGVDSAVAAALLREEGHDVTGVFLRNGVEAGPRARTLRQGCCGIEDSRDAARVADRLGIPFYSLDYAAGFASVIDDFTSSYAAGRTPNPCILCNRDLKFGELLRFADAIGADAVATGHYARLGAAADGRISLGVPADEEKDQTYVLFPLAQEQLARTRLPLGGMRKSEVRDAARARGLAVAEKPESMEICFVPSGDYRDLLAARAPDAVQPGDVVRASTGEVVGRHGGVGTVTMGQRRGVGVVGAEAVYVVGVDVARNRVLVGAASDLERRVVRVEGWNAVSVAEPPPGGVLKGAAKVRRNHPAASAAARFEGAGRVVVTFDAPVRSPAPGQALVLYDGDGRVLGGGWISGSS
ncbi:MAG: tRNA-specific 2-thiouridylase MnmA [Planctomycetes bacterium]|nr:tRNA-specific 2-thiouridylase MnmA [Planctomycetota bacterium]